MRVQRVTIFLIVVNVGLVIGDEIQKNSANATDEIKELFHGGKNVSKQTERSSSTTGIDLNQYHFAEGSSHNEDKSSHEDNPHSTKPQPDGREHGPVTNHQNVSQIISNVNINNNGAKINTSLPNPKNDSSLKKLDDMDLALGIPQVDHINNTSTIKARKGAIPIDAPTEESFSSKPNPSKIVPRKGVPSDNSLPNCFKTNNNTCFNVTKYQESDCSCCNSSTSSEEVIRTDSVNCSFCKPINNILVDGSLSCVKVCCKNKTLDSNKLITNKNNSGLEIVNVTKNETASHKKKHKPKFTQTPIDGDAENVTISTFQSKKAVVIPIVVSVLILPLLSILAFFIYKRTRDYWDKRYYKRMDFLIDGMYND